MDNLTNLKIKMNKTIDSTKESLRSIRTGRANPDLLNRIQVEYYGSKVPITQVASISAPESTLLVLNVFDNNAIKNIEKAIQTSELNLNPQSDGNVIRINIPELTEDRRKEFVKICKSQGEDSKISLRNIRREYVDIEKDNEKNKTISKDELKTNLETIQKETDKYMQEIDELIKHKENEIMQL